MNLAVYLKQGENKTVRETKLESKRDKEAQTVESSLVLLF